MSTTADVPPLPKPSEKAAAKLTSVTKLNFRSWLWLQHHNNTEFAPLARLVLGGGPESIWVNKPLKATVIAFDIAQMFATKRGGISEEHVRLAEEAVEAYREDDRSVEDLMAEQKTIAAHAEREIDSARRDQVREALGDIEPATIRNGYPRVGEGGIVRVNCDYTNHKNHKCPRIAVIGSARCDLHGGAYLEPDEIKAILERGQERVIAASELAITTVIDLMQNSVQDPVRLKAAEMLLDRAGFRAGMEITVAKAAGEAAKSPMSHVMERLERLAPVQHDVVDQAGKQIET